MPSDQFNDLLHLPLGRKIHDMITAHGGQVRFVGGVVRDILAGKALPSYPDIDMATDMAPDQAMVHLKAGGLRVIPTGLDHGTITIFERHNHHLKIELTTLRVDVATDGRHADVAFTSDWQGDAARRDFTINAIYLGFDGQIFDPFGGVSDLAAGHVRFIGDADQRIREDYLRMLRFFRFNARFAATSPDADAMAAITRHAAQLDQISGERIAKELDQLIPYGVGGLRPLVATGLDRILTSHGFDLDRAASLNAAVAPSDGPSLAARYAALISHDDIPPFIDRLKMSNALRAGLHYIASPVSDLGAWSEDSWPLHAWGLIKDHHKSWWLPQYLGERVFLAHLRAGQVIDPSLIHQMNSWSYPVFPLSGQDLLDRGFPHGQVIGQVLQICEAEWRNQKFTLTKGDLLSLAEGLDLGPVKE